MNRVLPEIRLHGSFVGANMHNADLRGARLEITSFNEANLTGVLMYGATYTADTVWPVGFDPEAFGAKLFTY